MTKEEILAKAREDNKDNDPIEIVVSRKAIAVGTAVGVILCMAMFIIKLLITKQIDLGLWALVFASSGAEKIYRGKKLALRKTLICGIICTVLAGIACFIYIALMVTGGQLYG